MHLLKKQNGKTNWVSVIILAILLITTFFPFVMLINMSLKHNVMISVDFLGGPNPIVLENYEKAFDFVFKPVLNSLFVCGVSLVFILLFVSMSGYAFGRLKFKGKKVLFSLLVAVLMIPYTLTIVPVYEICDKLGILNSYTALIMPYVSGQQVFGIILATTYFANLPEDMFEAARIDGASEIQMFIKIALPLSVPILITVGVTTLVAMYNDYIWPTVAMTAGDEMKTFAQVVFNNAAGNGTTDMGLVSASFIIGTIPLLVITLSCLKYYLKGLLEGAVKG